MTKIEREKRTIELMIKIYCKKKHKEKELCPECSELLEYALKRLMKEKIKKVMRFSGPRLIIYNPIELIRHMTY